jgi:hypothetical protein
MRAFLPLLGDGGSLAVGRCRQAPVMRPTDFVSRDGFGAADLEVPDGLSVCERRTRNQQLGSVSSDGLYLRESSS